MAETFLPELFHQPYLAELRVTLYLASRLHDGVRLFYRPSSPFHVRALPQAQGYDLRLKKEDVPYFTGFFYFPISERVPFLHFTPRSFLTHGSLFLELPSRKFPPSNIRALGTTLDFLFTQDISFSMTLRDVHQDISNGKEFLVPEKIIQRLRQWRYVY